MMKSKLTVTIDEIDNIRLERLAARFGMSKSSVLKKLISNGATYFFDKKVAPTNN